jgi:ATP-dependent RNA helicase RhlE
MPKKIEELSDNILVDPVKIEVHSNSSTVDTIDQSMYFVEDDNKSDLLINILNKSIYDSVIVFVKTKDRTELVLSDLLNK